MIVPMSLVLLALACVGCQDDQEEKQDDGQKRTAAILENRTAPAPTAPLSPGTEVYDFTALGHTGQRFKLSDFLEKPVVVYFCPRDASDACTQMALSFRDLWLKLNSRLSMVFAVSTEDTFVHREFVSEHELPLLLIADSERSVHRVMGVEPGNMVSYLIGSDGRVKRTFQSPDPRNHARQILNALRAGEQAQAPPPSAQPSATSGARPASSGQ